MTRQEAKTYILNEIASNPTLSAWLAINDPESHQSAWIDVVSAICAYMYVVWELFKTSLLVVEARMRTGGAKWLQYQVLQFQYQYALTWNPTTVAFEYSNIDEAAKIVKYCAVSEFAGTCTVKAYKDTSGVPEALNNAEFVALQAYIKEIKYPGQIVNLLSTDPDLLKTVITVFYNGMYSQPIIQAKVELAIDTYLKTLPFDGKFKIISLVDAIQKVEGVTDVYPATISAKYGLGAYQTIAHTYTPVSGYFVIDSNFPLASTITYTIE